MTKREKIIKEVKENLDKVKKIDLRYDDFGNTGQIKDFKKEAFIEYFLNNPLYKVFIIKEVNKIIVIFEMDFYYYEFTLYLE